MIVIVGPSYSGKSTLENALVEENMNLQKVVSLTSRPRRPNETHGVDYYFVSEKEFDETPKVESVSYSGFSYGIHENELYNIYDAKRVPIVVCEPNGADQINRWVTNNMPNKPILFVLFDLPIEVLKERAIKRDKNLDTYNKRRHVDEVMKDQFEALGLSHKSIIIDHEMPVEEMVKLTKSHYLTMSLGVTYEL